MNIFDSFEYFNLIQGAVAQSHPAARNVTSYCFEGVEAAEGEVVRNWREAW